MANPRSAEVMQKIFKKKEAMPGPSGPRFPITNADDLDKAVRAVGRARPNDEATRAKVRKFIISRAKALGLEKNLPATWSDDGSLKAAASQ